MSRLEESTSRKTLSPVELGLVWVPWKWKFAVVEP